MYSHEIKEYLKLKKYLITVDEYLKIIESPQIRSVSYNNGIFYIKTDDSYEFSLKINDNKENKIIIIDLFFLIMI